jgi:transcriptional regulator with XRE-family HTH domain
MKTLSDRLKHARAEKGWSQGQLATAADVAPSTVGNIEQGTRQSKGSIPQLAEALGVSYKWLAYGEGEMMDNNNPPKRAANDGDSLSPLAHSLAQLFDTLPTDDLGELMRVLNEACKPILAYKDLRQGRLPTPAPQSNQETSAAAPQPPKAKNT